MDPGSHRWWLVVLLVLSVVGTADGRSSTDADFDGARFSARVDDMHHRTAVPGIAVAVVQDGEVVHRRGRGIAGPDGQPVTGQTAFQIGSVTKSFTGLVLLQLAAEGKLDLDDPVVQYLPTFRTIDKARSDRITIDHLVTQRSGLTTLAGNRRQVSTGDGSAGPADAVAELASESLASEPGQRFRYSNANYAILTHLIEVVEGRPFEEVLASRILEPLGMQDSFVGAPSVDSSPVATGYRSWFRLARPTDLVLDRRMMGAGGIWASAEDLARYVAAVQSRDPRIVPDSADRLFAARPIQGPLGYAYGWFLYSDSDGGLIYHSGASPGFNSMVAIDPDTGRAVVVLTNLFGILHGQLAQAVAHEALGLEPVDPAPPLGPQLALWSGVAAILGILLWLFKTGRRLLGSPGPMRPWVRWLNLGAVFGMVGAAVTMLVLFPRVVGASIASGRVYFPDLMWLLFTACGMLVVLALGRLALVSRAGDVVYCRDVDPNGESPGRSPRP